MPIQQLFIFSKTRHWKCDVIYIINLIKVLFRRIIYAAHLQILDFPTFYIGWIAAAQSTTACMVSLKVLIALSTLKASAMG